MKPNARLVPAAALVTVVIAGPVLAAYFHEAHRHDALLLSDWSLKERFVVAAAVPTGPLPDSVAADILATPDAAGLFEQTGGMRIPDGRCGEDRPKNRPCELTWEAGNLAKSNGAAGRRRETLTLKAAGEATLALRDWTKCAPGGECDSERFTYLGQLGRAPYHAVEIGYGHDSPSLVLVHTKSGKMLDVHYGSEATFLNPAQTLLANFEDLNDATSLLVTDLAAAAPAIDLQCLGARSATKSFGLSFKRWLSNAAFELVLSENTGTTPNAIPVRFERSANGSWITKSATDLKTEGFECRARAAAS